MVGDTFDAGSKHEETSPYYFHDGATFVNQLYMQVEPTLIATIQSMYGQLMTSYEAQILRKIFFSPFYL